VSHIDVLWFGGDTDMLVPEFAFEVEHTTDVIKGLGRLHDLHRSGQRTRLFIILPIDKMGKFDKEIGRSLFRDIIYTASLKALLFMSLLSSGREETSMSLAFMTRMIRLLLIGFLSSVWFLGYKNRWG
jgi:hypothetical protein